MSSDTRRPGHPDATHGPLTAEMADDTINDVAKTSKAPQTLGERLKLARQLRGLGVNQLNKLLRLPGKPAGQDRVSIGYISSLERGRRTEVEAAYVIAICDVLKVRPEWLTQGAGRMTLDSGKHQAVYSSAEQDKPNLERVLEAMGGVRGRWSQAAMNAARGLHVSDLPVDVWPKVLDRLHKALEAVIGDLDV